MRKQFACLALVTILALPAVAHAVSLAWVPNAGDATAYNVYRNGVKVATVPHDLSKAVDQLDCFTGKVSKSFIWQDKSIPIVCTDSWRVSAVFCGAESGLVDAPFCPPSNPQDARAYGP